MCYNVPNVELFSPTGGEGIAPTEITPSQGRYIIGTPISNDICDPHDIAGAIPSTPLRKSRYCRGDALIARMNRQSGLNNSPNAAERV